MQPRETMEALAQRVTEGDVMAKAQLQARLERQLARIARRALGSTPGSSSLGKRIRMTAHRLDFSGHSSPHLAADVAANLSQTVASRLWTGTTQNMPHTQPV